MARYLDLDRWQRRPAFEFFRRYDSPYFNVCAPLDVTRLHALTRERRELSFSLAVLYLALRVANELEPFRYRLEEGRVRVHERLHAGTTTIVGEERLEFIYFDFHPEFGRFQSAGRAARESAARDAAVIDAQDHRTDLIHFSTLPWVAFTSISHARSSGREDSVPKITFGRHHPAGEQRLIPVSVEVHHALMDGLHVGRYLEALQRYLDEPAAALGLT